ncbi:MAG TPA: hypothetical protein VMP00_11680 [Burkholderiales bacterium]|nr:hypothetical protein [Burkholderiales bacterium]
MIRKPRKVATVLERLAKTYTDAQLEHYARRGVHEFIVRLATLRHVVDFTDDLLKEKDPADIADIVIAVVDRAATESLPVHFMVRSDNFDTVLRAQRKLVRN